jgi:hypothetical protein
MRCVLRENLNRVKSARSNDGEREAHDGDEQQNERCGG